MTLPSFYCEDTPASANETWARLHSDPLFAVRLPTFLSPHNTHCMLAIRLITCCQRSRLVCTPAPVGYRFPAAQVLSCPLLPLNQMCRGLQIRQQEIGARKQIAQNPVQMESIKAEVGFNAAALHVLMVLHALL